MPDARAAAAHERESHDWPLLLLGDEAKIVQWVLIGFRLRTDAAGGLRMYLYDEELAAGANGSTAYVVHSPERNAEGHIVGGLLCRGRRSKAQEEKLAPRRGRRSRARTSRPRTVPRAP